MSKNQKGKTMKILINASFKAIRTGDYVVADIEADEFILDTDDSELSKAQLLEIATSNKIELGKKDRASDMLEKLEAGFEKMDLPRQDEKSDTQKVAEIVKAGCESGESDDVMIVKIIQSGIRFKAAIKMLNNELTSGGYRITNKARQEEIRNLLVEAEFEADDYSEWQAMIETIVAAVADTESSQATKAMRKYCKEFEIEIPSAPKKPKGGFRTAAYNWMIANPEATDKELTEWVVTENKKDAKVAERMLPVFKFAKAFAESLYGEEEEEG